MGLIGGRRGIATTAAVTAAIVTAALLPAAPSVARPKPRSFVPGEPNTTVVGGSPDTQFRDGDRGRSDELEALRSRRSKTYVTGYGAYETDFYPASVHYRGSEGAWKSIDNSLVTSDRDGYAHRNKANRYRLDLPSNIAGRPVRFEDGKQHWAAFQLKGRPAAASAEISGNRAVYRDVFAGVDIAFEALNDVVKEEIILKDADAVSSFRWRLTTSQSLTAAVNDSGGIDFTDASGALRFSVHSPVIFDSSDTDAGVAPPHSYRVAAAAGGYDVDLVVDESWLRDPSRVFPVTVDPTIDLANRDCQIQNGDKKTISFCTRAKMKIGNTGTYKKRALLKWDVSNVPDNAEILDAEVGLWVENSYQYSMTSFSLRPITEGPWNSEVTWIQRTQWNDWSAVPNGYLDPSRGYKEQEVAGSNGWVRWHPTSLVKEWVAGTSNNRGVVIKQAAEGETHGELHVTTTDTSDSSRWPKLTVTWDQGGMGEQKTYKLEDEDLTDRMHLHVNPGGGNLSLHHEDLEIKGTGLDLKVERHYNSVLPTQAVDTGSHVGDGWNLSTAGDVGLLLFEDGSAAYFAPSGYRAPYTKDPDDPLQKQTGTKDFITPPGPDADLTKVDTSADRTYRLTMEKSKEKYFFSDRGILTAHVDKNGNTISFLYTGDLLTSIEDTRGRVTTLTYNTSNQLTTIEDPAARLHRYAYDGNNLISYTNPENETTRYTYDNSDHLTEVTDPIGNKTRFSYDASFRIATVQHVTDDNGDTDPANDIVDQTTFTYKASDTRCPTNSAGEYLQATVVTDARGNDTTYCYNKVSRVRRILDAKDNPTTMQYNSDTNVTSIEDKKGKTVFGYDSSGNDVQSVTSPDESTPSGSSVAGAVSNTKHGNDGHDHDGDGKTGDEHKHLPTQMTTAEGFVTKFFYDANHNLDRVQKAPATLNVEFSYAYDARGNLTRIAAPEGPPDPDPANNDTGNDTTFEYYPNGELHRIVYPQPLGPIEFEYDTLSRPVAMTDGKGQRTQYTYDAVDRLTSITYADGSSMTYTYDSAGNLVQESDVQEAGTQAKTADYSYDARNRLVKEVRAADRSKVFYTYDGVSNLTSLDDDNDASAGKVKYRYDVTNVLDQVTEPDGDTIEYRINVVYKPNQIQYPVKPGTTDQRVTVTINYFNSGKVKLIEATAPGATSPFTKLKHNYTDDKGDTDETNDENVSLLQKRTDENGKETSFTYDALGRLTGAKTENGTTVVRNFTYKYDANSNRTFENDNGTETQFHFDPANTLDCSYSGDTRTDCPSVSAKTTYDYDANGSLTMIDDTTTTTTSTSPDYSFGYDARNRNASVSTPDAELSFDYLGATQERRIGKTVTPAGGSAKTTGYSYNVLGLSAEGGSPPTFYMRDMDGKVLGRFNATADEDYYVHDSLGSVTDVFDTSGNVKKAYTYGPYGEQPSGQLDDTFYNPMRFGQGYFDQETGLHKLGVRYYDENRARFTQVDPIKGGTDDPVTLNLYQYGKMSPVNFADPSGRMPVLIPVLVGAAVGVASYVGALALGAGDEAAAFVGGCAGTLAGLAFTPASAGALALGCVATGGLWALGTRLGESVSD